MHQQSNSYDIFSTYINVLIYELSDKISKWCIKYLIIELNNSRSEFKLNLDFKLNFVIDIIFH